MNLLVSGQGKMEFFKDMKPVCVLDKEKKKKSGLNLERSRWFLSSKYVVLLLFKGKNVYNKNLHATVCFSMLTAQGVEEISPVGR